LYSGDARVYDTYIYINIYTPRQLNEAAQEKARRALLGRDPEADDDVASSGLSAVPVT
jgi:hypothetical protein